MVRKAKGAKTEGDHVSSLELSAPAGWKKFILKKAWTSQRSEIVFISPTGEEIRNKKHLGQHLRSNPGGPSSSEFDWGFGETPRRSARLIERTKETQAAEENSPKKRGRHSSSKKKKGETDSVVEDDASEEEEPPKKQKRQSTSKNRTKQKKISADAMIEDGAPDKGKLSTQELEREEDAEMKDAEVGSVDEKEEAAAAAAKAITEDSFAEGSDYGTKLKKDALDAEVEDASESEKIATQALDNPKVTDMKDAEDVLVEGKEEASLKAIVEDSSAKVDSKDEGKNKKVVDAEVEQHEAPDSVKIVATEVPENLEDPNMKDAEDASVKNKEEAAADPIMDDVDADVKGKALKSEKIDIQPLENIEDSDKKDDEYGSINVKEEAAAKDSMQDSSVTVDSNEVNRQNKEVAAPAEDFHEEEIKKQTLLNNNRKGEQVSPFKVTPTANCIDLKSPEKASAIV